VNAQHRKAVIIGRTLALILTVSLSHSRGDAQEKSSSQKVYQTGDVHLKQSRVYIHVGKTGFGHEHAVEGQLSSGTLKLNEAEGELVFAMKTFTADTNAARKYIGLSGTTAAGTRSKVNANMRGRHVLNVGRFPTAKFKVKSVSPLKQKSRRGLPQYRIEGDFTLHGKTRLIRFTADAAAKDGWLHVRGGFSILQTNYGITPYSTGLGTIGVANKLTIWGDLWVAEGEQVQADRTDSSKN
jgi:hypothetical protein